MRWSFISALLVAVFLPACGSSGDAGTCPAGSTATYAGEIKPIVERACTGCHASTLSGNARSGAPGSVNLDSYAAAAAAGAQSNQAVQSGHMPPGGGLSAADRTAFACWIAQGTPQ